MSAGEAVMIGIAYGFLFALLLGCCSAVSSLRKQVEAIDKRTQMPPCDMCQQPAVTLKVTIEEGRVHHAKLCRECLAEAVAADLAARDDD